MDVSVDRCYYHNDRPSVAVCSICGAGICQDCTANNNGQIVCVPCFNKLLKEDHREYLRQAKAAGGWKNKFTTAREFILPGIIGLILAVLGWVAAFHVSYSPDHIFFFVCMGFIDSYVMFTVPFGISFVHYMLYYVFGSRIYRSSFIEALAEFLHLFIYASTLLWSWIYFPIILIRFLLKMKKEKQSKTE